MPSLITEKTTNLSAGQKRALLSLAASCLVKGSGDLPYPQDEEDATHYLLWIRAAEPGKKELIGALAVLLLDEDTAECIAVIRPAHRRKGYFTRLLNTALRDFDPCHFLFPMRPEATDIRASLESIGAKYDHTDLMMETLMEENPPAAISPSFPEVFRWPEGTAEPIGSCRIVPLSAGCACLCQVEVAPESRGLGHGTAMIRLLLCRLRECGVRRVILHVEKENIPAVALYKKTGFRVTETLSYYRLSSDSRPDD